MKTHLIAAMLCVSAAVASGAALPQANTETAAAPDGPPTSAVVYVRSQDLYYDSIVLGDLPPVGPFQLLEMGPDGLETDFGPGDPGYLGGRWAEDFDGDGEFNYFLCPLIPPGRDNP